ncbi:MAG: type I DNA topoisomerase [Eubacteriales bacterium]|nr:type I DNA topoisomerase [Eubacteriales bacterium]
MSKLVIVESPAKAKTIGKYLGVDYVVKASMGHLRDLPKKKMSVDIEHDFKPEYVPIEGKEKLIDELRDAVEESDFVYLATDPDREGEAISWHLKELLHLNDSYTKRVTFNEITKHAVQEGIAHPRDIDLDLVDAQQARRILDRIVGYELSPFLWRKVKRGLSAGRVQSVATRMVVDREKEIRAFIPEEYWSLEAELAAPGGTFTASFYGDGTGKVELKTEEQTQAIVDAVTGKPFTVNKVKRGKKRKKPAPPFITSTLQQEASRKLSFVPRRTMAVAQQLYEGIEIGEQGLTGLITYMRTDSLRLSDEATEAAKEYIIGRYGATYYPDKKRVFRTKNGAQDAHEAIRPTNVNLTPEDIQAYLTPEQYKLYKLIWSRFVACQMAEAILDTVSADILSEGYVFRASGYKVAFPGFTAVYEESTDDAKQTDTAAGKPLPDFAEGDVLDCRKLTPAQHFTQPPARYTEASLIKAMEEKGIGRPSTYAPTISTILERDYVAKEGRSLRPTPLGEGVTELLVDKFQSISDLEFTAHMEEELDEVENGKIPYVEVLRRFYGGFEAALEQAEKDLEGQRIKIKDEVTDEICEKCGKHMVIKSGRFGKFLACSGYPDCKNTKNIAIKTGVNCPKCGGNIVELKSKRGFPFLGCDNYPECTFMSWDKVTKKQCPECGSALFRHYDRETGEAHFMCYKDGCGYKEFISKRTPRKTKAQKEAEAKAAAEAAGENVEAAAEEKPKKTRKTAAKKTTAKKATTKKTTKKTTKTAAEGEEAPKKRTTRKKAAATEEQADA